MTDADRCVWPLSVVFDACHPDRFVALVTSLKAVPETSMFR